MSRVVKSGNSHGSLKHLQVLINSFPSLLANELHSISADIDMVDWKSPLEEDDYAEYSDISFIKVLGLEGKLVVPLKDFWPSNGPNWDALGLTNNGVILVEAKAHLNEIGSSCGAKRDSSIKKISSSLNEVKASLGIGNESNWMKDYYQYANRIAHLYYLRTLNMVDTHLVFLYFINDTAMNGPKNISEWEVKIQEVECQLGLHKDYGLRKYIHNVFVNIKDIY